MGREQGRPTPPEVKAFLESSKEPTGLIRHINILDINRGPQARKTFTDIEELADSLTVHGLIQAVTVAVFTEEDCEEYLFYLSKLHKKELSTSDFKPVTLGRKKVFLFLIAGERRYRAHLFLKGNPCSSCKEEFGEESGGCYHRHPKLDDGIDAKLDLDSTPYQLARLQLTENIYVRPPQEEEARVYSNLFELTRHEDPKYSFRKLAQEVGRTAEAMSKAVKYCELPEPVQELVENESINYAVACELFPLQQAGIAVEDILIWAERAKVNEWRVPEIRLRVRNFLKDLNPNQTMFEIFSENWMREEARKANRQTFEARTVLAFWMHLRYLNKINQSILNGEFETIYSKKSPRRAFKALVARQKEVLPLLKDIKAITESEANEASIILEMVEAELARFGEFEEREDEAPQLQAELPIEPSEVQEEALVVAP